MQVFKIFSATDHTRPTISIQVYFSSQLNLILSFTYSLCLPPTRTNPLSLPPFATASSTPHRHRVSNPSPPPPHLPPIIISPPKQRRSLPKICRHVARRPSQIWSAAMFFFLLSSPSLPEVQHRFAAWFSNPSRLPPIMIAPPDSVVRSLRSTLTPRDVPLKFGPLRY